MSYPKPLPVLDVETRPFWEACQSGRLMLQRGTECGHIRFPPTRFCAKCRSIKCDWIESKGHGRVFSWIVVRHPVPRDVYAQEVPYVVADRAGRGRPHSKQHHRLQAGRCFGRNGGECRVPRRYA